VVQCLSALVYTPSLFLSLTLDLTHTRARAHTHTLPVSLSLSRCVSLARVRSLSLFRARCRRHMQPYTHTLTHTLSLYRSLPLSLSRARALSLSRAGCGRHVGPWQACGGAASSSDARYKFRKFRKIVCFAKLSVCPSVLAYQGPIQILFPEFWPSPTLSPTDPVPRGLLTLCPHGVQYFFFFFVFLCLSKVCVWHMSTQSTLTDQAVEHT